MKLVILCAISAVFLLACNSPQRGDDPVTRDSIGDPIDPQDTTADRLNPDSVAEEPKLRF